MGGDRLGFVGCGTISAAMIEGLIAAGHAAPILVSPRNAEIAAGLAARFPQVRVAASNQAVLDGSDLVIIAVRPQIVRDVLPTLRFRADHRVLSLVAAVGLDYLRAATAPAASVVRAVPLPSVARLQGPTAVFPPDPEILALFDQLGAAVPLDDEAAFGAFSAATSVMSSYFAIADTLTRWMVGRGIASEQAGVFVAMMLKGLAGTPGDDFGDLADEHQTAGGLNEQIRAHLTQAGMFAALEDALDGVMVRIEAGSQPAD